MRIRRRAFRRSTINIADDIGTKYGDAGRFEWSTDDANANAMILNLPAGGAVDVPVFASGIAIKDTDLGLFNGITQPWEGVVDADKDSAVGLTFSGDDLATISTLGAATLVLPNTVLSQRFRVAIADVNAGYTLLSAIPGAGYRVVNVTAIAYGGAVGAVTTVDILGTQSASSVKLVAFAQASLTQSTVLQMGDSGAAVLADGASYIACDDNTAITVDITGSDATTATGIDFIVQYVIA